MKKGGPTGPPFLSPTTGVEVLFFNLIHHSLEGLGVVHGEVSENLAVEFDARLGQLTHECTVGHAVLARSRIDPLNPQAAELTLAKLSSDVCVLKAFLDGVFRDRPNIFTGTVVPLGHFEDLLATSA